MEESGGCGLAVQFHAAIIVLVDADAKADPFPDLLFGEHSTSYLHDVQYVRHVILSRYQCLSVKIAFAVANVIMCEFVQICGICEFGCTIDLGENDLNSRELGVRVLGTCDCMHVFKQAKICMVKVAIVVASL